MMAFDGEMSHIKMIKTNLFVKKKRIRYLSLLVAVVLTAHFTSFFYTFLSTKNIKDIVFKRIKK